MGLFTGSYLWDVLGVLTAFVAVIYAYFVWSYQHWKRKGVPYIEPTIPFGSIGNPFTQSIGEQIGQIYKEVISKGWKYCGVHIFLSPSLLVVDQDLIKLILTKDFQHFMDRGVYMNERDDPLGCHLFALNGSKWRNLRNKLSPAFTSGKLKAMFQTLVDCGLILENYIEDNFKSGEPVDIKDILACFSTDVIGSCAFGIECNSFKEPNSAFRYYGNKIFDITPARALMTLISETFPRLCKMFRVRQVPTDVSQFFTKMVQDTVSYREKNNVIRKDFMQLLIDIRKKENDGESEETNTLSMDEMVAQSFVFFAAGFETSATTMTFALFELATHSDIQDRLRVEINTVLARHGGRITYDSLSEMKYLGQVIDETLRMYSPARFLLRYCVKDFKVPGEDFVIEQNTKILISLKGAHYNEEFWPEPKKFDPDRFSDENKKTAKPYTHMPFGEGPRICIGERFGLMQVKVGLTCLLRKFKVTLNERTKLPLKMSANALISSAEGGIWLNLENIH